ncbi:MAG TPA: histidine phosphatase family protein [Nonomuraea sp.]|nr:histidine phosphatase family protein [Nonomuraea sp.]
MTRTLILIRHAQAVSQRLGSSDKDRQLTERGERDAEQAGEELRKLGLVPELVLSSSATRTKQTTALVFPGATARYEDGLYQAYAEELLERLRRLDPDLSTVALCGHNPAVHELAVMLTGDVTGFEPGTFAVIECAAPWPELSTGEGEQVTRWCPTQS